MSELENRVDDLEEAIFDLVVNAPEPKLVRPKKKVKVKKVKGERGDKGDGGSPGKSGRNGKDGLRGLNGVHGKNGLNGLDGVDGEDGQSAYEAWLSLGSVGTEKDFIESLKGEKGKDGRIEIREVNNGAGTVLKAGDIGRFQSQTTIVDEDDFVIKRNGSLFRVTAETLAAYIVAENTTTKEITFADSPYSVTILDDFINVDSSSGSVVINLLPLAIAPKKPIYVSQSDGAPNTTTLNPDGSDIIVGSAPLSSDGNTELIVPFATAWRAY